LKIDVGHQPIELAPSRLIACVHDLKVARGNNRTTFVNGLLVFGIRVN